MKLVTTLPQFEALHEAVDKTRASRRVVKVDREALAALLRDHSEMAAELKVKE